MRYEQLADITVSPIAKSALGNEQFQLTTPISTSTVRDYCDGPVPHLISPEAVIEIYLVPSNDDEPLLGGRGAYCIRICLRRLRLRPGPELPEYPGEVALSLPSFADQLDACQRPTLEPNTPARLRNTRSTNVAKGSPGARAQRC